MRPRLNLGKSNSRNDARFSVDDMVRPHLVEFCFHPTTIFYMEMVKPLSLAYKAFEFAFPIVSNSGHMEIQFVLQFEYAIF